MQCENISKVMIHSREMQFLLNFSDFKLDKLLKNEWYSPAKFSLRPSCINACLLACVCVCVCVLPNFSQTTLQGCSTLV
jgi:hypothetical protein